MNVSWLRVTAFALCGLVCAEGARTQQLFFQPPNYAGGGQTVTADFNGDGKPDLVSSDGTVLLGRGDGTFTTAAALSVTGDNIVAGDFNGDGKPDVIVTSAASTVLSVLLGNGDGTFQAAQTVNVGASLKSLVTADFNKDGKLDVAGVNDTSGLFVLLGAGNGSFTAASGSPLALAPGSFIVAGDFNGGSRTDLVFGASSNSSTSIPGGVFLGNGDGTFKTESPVTIGLDSLTAAGAAELNGDGKLDLIFSGLAKNTAKTVVLLGNGDGTFQAASSTIPANGVIAIADLNGDHKDDIITDDSAVTRIFVGNGDGTFSPGNSYIQNSGGSGFHSLSVVTADFDGNGSMDVAAENMMLLGNGDGSFQGNNAIIFSPGVSTAVVGDFNGDGSADVAGSNGTNVVVYLNDGSGRFTEAHSYSSSAQPIAVSDLNHDGKLDLLLSTQENNSTVTFSVMFGNGDGTFGTARGTGLSVLGLLGGPSGAAVKLVDLNGDQIPDLVLLTSQGVNVLLGKGDGTFAAAVNYFAGSTPTIFQTGDFNNDGKSDLAVGSDAGIGLLAGKGDGTFAPAVFSNSGTVSFSTAADVNGDGNLDLIGSGGNVLVYLGNGDGTFQVGFNTAPFGPVNGFTTLAAVDVNGDGKVDVIAGPGIWFVEGNGDGTFAAPINVVEGSRALGPFVADFNGDGRPDALTPMGGDEPEGLAAFLNVSGASIADFIVTATAVTPGSIAAGGTASTTVAVTPANGFATSVAFSCVGLPAGSSCAFAPASTSGASLASTLTIRVSSTTASGTYYVAVVGTGGGLTHSRLLPLDVTGTPDFVLSTPSGGTSTVAAGKPATYSLSVGGSGGFSGNVALSCGGAPTGAICSVSPMSVMVSGGSAVTAMVTVTTTARSEIVAPTANRDREDRWTPWPGTYSGPRLVAMYAAGFAGAIGLMMIFGMRLRRRMSWATMVGGCLLLAGLVMSGCGGGSNGGGTTPPSGGSATGTPAGSYTITVTAMTGSGANAVSHTTTLTLVVQ